MKNFYLLFLISFFSIKLSYADTPIKIGILSDVHFLSEQLMDDGYAVSNYIFTTGKNIKITPSLLDVALNDFIKNKINVLLVSGDITKDGEYQSHVDFVEKLKPLAEKGVKIFVIPGNHDINYPYAESYIGNKTIKVKNTTAEEFRNIYACTYNNIIARDTASLNYVAQLSDKIRLIAIDAARYKEYTDKSMSSGRISKATEKWISNQLDKARADSITTIGMMHWGIVEHFMYQYLFFPDYLVNEWQKHAQIFADKGIKMIFTGHFHANDITAYTSPSGNTIYDTETASLSSYPYAYRLAEISEQGVKIRTKFINEIKGDSSLQAEGKERMLLLAKERSKALLQSKDITFSKEITESLSDIMAQIFVLHARGNEKMNDVLKTAIKNMTATLGAPIDEDLIQLDFYPDDNDVYISF